MWNARNAEQYRQRSLYRARKQLGIAREFGVQRDARDTGVTLFVTCMHATKRKGIAIQQYI